MTDIRTTKQIGDQGEDLACKFLEKKGFEILKRNYLIRGGELDIIAMDGETLVFVEVKTRYNTEFGYAREAVTPWKLRYLKKVATYYMMETNWHDKSCRIDLVAIDYPEGNPDGQPAIELIQNITQ